MLRFWRFSLRRYQSQAFLPAQRGLSVLTMMFVSDSPSHGADWEKVPGSPRAICLWLSSADFIIGLNPYNYTNGRWLQQDKLQRSSRRIVFDFPALCNKAISQSSGATKIIKFEKKDGGFSRDFIFTVFTLKYTLWQWHRQLNPCQSSILISTHPPTKDSAPSYTLS